MVPAMSVDRELYLLGLLTQNLSPVLNPLNLLRFLSVWLGFFIAAGSKGNVSLPACCKGLVQGENLLVQEPVSHSFLFKSELQT